jgi:xanthine dehydrogenase YagR molybdenum-binding subunit
LADDKIVRYVGEPIAAIAAKDLKTAREAAGAIRIVSQPLTPVVGLTAARKPDAPIVFKGLQRNRAGDISEGTGAPALWTKNVRGPTAAFSHKTRKARRWIADAKSNSDPLLVQATFHTGTQSHTCLEPHVAVARFDGENLTVHISTQSVFHMMELIAKRYKLKPAQVRVVADHVGGGFGSKGGSASKQSLRSSLHAQRTRRSVSLLTGTKSCR